MRLHLDRVESPIGEILLVTDEQGALRALDFHDYETRMRRLLRLHYGTVDLCDGPSPALIRQALAAYFQGDHMALAQVPVATGGTSFQKAVWAALRTIPIGSTVSYGVLAERIGRAGASRAVGLANGSNPVAVVVPCHRVIGANSALTGFGGGLHRKSWLLAHEGVALAPERSTRRTDPPHQMSLL